MLERVGIRWRDRKGEKERQKDGCAACRVNKPFLPVAAGDLSVPAAWALVITFAIVGISIVATNFGPLITGLYILGLSLGAIYSVPPLRLKRFAVPAFLIIATVRAFILFVVIF